MKKGNYIRVVGAVLLSVLFLAFVPSCRDKPAISNQIVVTAIGLEKERDVYHLSIQAVDSLKTAGSLSEQSESATAVYRASGPSVAQALQSFLNETGRSTYILHNQIIGLGMSQCRQTPLSEQLDYFIRNLEGRSLVDLVICRGDPSALLSIRSGNDAIPAEYVAQLLDEGADSGWVFSSRLLDVQRAMSGMYDVALPILAVEQEVPRLDGTALFRDGVLVGELTEEQTTALLIADNRVERCLFTANGLTFRLSQTDCRLDIAQQQGGYGYRFSVGGVVDMVETTALVTNAQKEQAVHSLSQELARIVCETVETVVSDYDCDPLGLARKTAKQYRTVTQQQARRLLKNCHVTAQVDVRLGESGCLR